MIICFKQSAESVKENERSLQGCRVTRARRHEREGRRGAAKKEESKVTRPQGRSKKGAVEVRRLWVKKWAAEYVLEQLGVPNCRSLIRVDKEIRRKGKTPVFSTRYYISSLDPDEVSASEFQEYILGHWEIENCLHGVKDKEYGEDKHVLGRKSWGEAWTVLTNIAVPPTCLACTKRNLQTT